METPAQIEFEDIQASAGLQGVVDRHIAELENHFGRITAAHIVVKGPGERHQIGGQYQVSVRLALPDGREVDVGRTPKGDERYADLTFAVDDAFKRAAGNYNTRRGSCGAMSSITRNRKARG